VSAEQAARKSIDELLGKAGWRVCDLKDADLHASRGVAICEFKLEPPSPARAGECRGEGGYADYLLYVDGKAAGVVEAKKVGATLTGVEVQSGRYAQGLPASLPAWTRPLPFVYESTGVETHFTNGLDPEPRARNVFAFHKPDTLVEWLDQCGSGFSPTPASSRPEGRPTDPPPRGSGFSPTLLGTCSQPSRPEGRPTDPLPLGPSFSPTRTAPRTR